MNKWAIFHMIMQHAPRRGLKRIIEHPRAMHEIISANLNIRNLKKNSLHNNKATRDHNSLQGKQFANVSMHQDIPNQ